MIFAIQLGLAAMSATLVDHWSREGISYALRSGDIAGHAAARLVTAADETKARAADQYERHIDSVLGVEMSASRSLVKLFTRNPGLAHTALTRLPPAWHHLDSCIAGRTSVARIMATPVGRATAALTARLPCR
ncbi:hypothetical protein [Streptomyces hawaiiensis]|uniref:Uncharacterized protein n=2 Tax=Streptomyces hawaiiensis TaxID=67305 RepID=A0A6G5RQW9_9ACTN|nr:hypothetical protein [Streptomyces hawaiiensis]QCD60176.1 hypothetical protein CEB94_39470 [Streptomyces hawaiiensis]